MRNRLAVVIRPIVAALTLSAALLGHRKRNG
jgi:hypothetical protein